MNGLKVGFCLFFTTSFLYCQIVIAAVPQTREKTDGVVFIKKMKLWRYLSNNENCLLWRFFNISKTACCGGIYRIMITVFCGGIYRIVKTVFCGGIYRIIITVF
jgi:hypothetical protein